MKLKFAGALVAATAAVTMLAGCPGLIPGTQPPAEEFKFSPDALITGKLQNDGQPIQFTESNYTHKVKLKNVATAENLTVEAPLQNGTFFEFTSGVTEGTNYQFNSDYTGTAPTKASDINMIRQFVSNPIKAEKAATDPMVTVDLKWDMKPTVAENAAFAKGANITFTVDKSSSPALSDAEYQLRVVDTNNVEKYVSTFSATPSFTWDQKATGGSQVDAGNYQYHIRFKKAGKATYSGTDAYFGDSFKIPFKINP